MRMLFLHYFLPSCRLTSIETDLSSRDLLSGLQAGATAATLEGPRLQALEVCADAAVLAKIIELPMRQGPHTCVGPHLRLYWRLHESHCGLRAGRASTPRPTATLAGGHAAVCYHRDSVIGTWVSCCGTHGPANSIPTSLVHG